MRVAVGIITVAVVAVQCTSWWCSSRSFSCRVNMILAQHTYIFKLCNVFSKSSYLSSQKDRHSESDHSNYHSNRLHNSDHICHWSGWWLVQHFYPWVTQSVSEIFDNQKSVLTQFLTQWWESVSETVKPSKHSQWEVTESHFPLIQ